MGKQKRTDTDTKQISKRSIIAHSNETDGNAAFESVCSQIDKCGTPLLIVFSSSNDIFSLTSKKFHMKYKKTTILGATSFMNFSSEGYADTGISALAIYNGILCSSGFLLDVSNYPDRFGDNIEKAIAYFGDDTDDLCCFQFTTAFCNSEELVQDTFKKYLLPYSIPIFGGSAGSNDGLRKTFVSLNGITYDEGCVFVLVKNLNGHIHLFKENLFKPTEHYYMATDVDCDCRAVYELNHRPAANVVAESLHVPIEELKDKLRMHPVGRIEGDKIYITEVDDVYDDGHITYYSRIYNYTDLVQLEADDVYSVWDETSRDVKELVANPSFSIVINCLSRSKYFISRDIFTDFQTKLKNDYGTYIGFSGYGEQMDFQHLNQTMLLAVFE